MEKPLAGWGGYRRSIARLYRPEKISDMTELIGGGRELSHIGRGLGRSYGDASLNANRSVVSIDRLNRFLDFDPENGLLTCEGGVTLEQILAMAVPLGWFPPVLPGTKFVTLGGAVACDVHGKNHHWDGSFSNFVEKLELLLANGQRVECSREERSELFWATVGGMGLTGIILSVACRLRRVESAFIQVKYLRTSDLEETMRSLEEQDKEYPYSVAWLDGLATGRSLGRGILILGDHATADQLPASLAAEPLRLPRRRSFRVPFRCPDFVLNATLGRFFNALYYRRFPQQGREDQIDYDRFFFPLDTLGRWNRLYGRRGFLQYQCVFPDHSAAEALPEMLGRFQQQGIPLFLVVLKRMGPETGLISFPRPGYTLALDMPMRGEALLPFLDQLDGWVIEKGGRVYLAKDAALSASSFQRMYPRLEQWLRVKSQVDPHHRFGSDLSRRLGITPEVG